MAETMKIAVIGGGVIGLYLSQKLTQKGHKTTVFEQRSQVGKECCSGLFSERIFSFFPESRNIVDNEITSCLINFPKKQIKLSFSKPFYVMDHAKLDRLALNLALEREIQIEFNRKITPGSFEKMKKDHERIIGCDGALSPTREYLNLPQDKMMLGILGFEDQKDNSRSVETWATKNGFLWKIPRGKNIEWGIMEKPETARKLFDEFIEQKKIKIEDLRSAVIPQGFALPKNKKITLCGDASGLTKPWSGGGVLWGLVQADILLKNFPNFIQYRNEATGCFLPKIIASKAIKSVVYYLGYNFPLIVPGSFRIDGDYLLRTRK